MMAMTASRNWPCRANRIAVRPAQSAARVITFGISRLIEKPRSPRRLRKSSSMTDVLFPKVPLELDRPARGCVPGIELGDHRLAADHALPRRHQQARAGRQ